MVFASARWFHSFDMSFSPLKYRRAVCLALALVAAGFAALLAGGTRAAARVSPAGAPRPAPKAVTATALQTFNLADFGAVGDGRADDGPALQAALNAVLAAGGGRLNVPAGRFAIVTPVVANAPGPGVELEIRGVESTVPIASPHAGGYALTRGLGLVSEIAPKTGTEQIAILLQGYSRFHIQDIAFIGSAAVATDAKITLAISFVRDAVVRHCEFYGLATLGPGGSIIQAWHSRLSVEQTAFLGSTANSGLYTPVIQNLEWEGINVEDSIFADYGQRAELYGKMGYGAPLCWVNVGHATPPTADSPRREVVIRRVFFDEGGWQAINSQPARYQSPTVPLDLFYATGLYVNVANFWQPGHYLSGLREVLVEDSLYTWAERADSAIYVSDAKDAIIDRVRTEKSASRLRIDHPTQRVTVIDSVYTDLASSAQQTVVINTTAPDQDPVLYVRNQFQSALGREVDAAAHYNWSRYLLDCNGEAACLTTRRATLAAYLATRPAATFVLSGRVADEDGQPLAGVPVALTGMHSVSTTTGADGRYAFRRLPTSGSHTVTVGPMRHYTFAAPAQTINLPAGDRTVDFVAKVNRHAISGRLTDDLGRAIQGATLTLSGGQQAAATSDANGNYSFPNLAAGRSYTVTASSSRHSFAVPSQSFTDLDGDRTANFGGTPLFFSVGGRVTDTANNPVAGLSVSLSGGKTGATTTDSGGNFLFTDLPRGGNYTVTPARLVGYTYNPAARNFGNLTSDAVTSIVAVPTNYKIAGRVTSAGAGVAGATVTLTGTRLATATTDAAGAYSFSVPVYGDFTVTASKTHYTFAAPSLSFQGVTSDRTADFAATLNRHRLSGSVRRANGAAMAGVTVTLSGGQAATATTDQNGAYAFANLPAGAAYTVTPSKAGYDFGPAAKSFAELGADQTADFTVTPANVPVAGRVASGGAGVAGVTVTLSGSKTGTATTDSSGNYAFSVQSEGGYTVTPSKKHYKFAPQSLSFNNPTSAQTANFEATLNRHSISGRVTNQNNAGLPGVTVALSGAQAATATTDAQGNYSFANLPAGGNYAVAASKANYSFGPASVAVGDLGADSAANFTGTLLDYTVAGRVTVGGAGLPGVTVTLSGSKAGTATTDASGGYSFTVPAEGGYTVTPALRHYTFAPASATFAALGGNRTADFAAALNRHAVSGRVADRDNAGIQGVTVTLSGAQAGTATTDAQGNYSFPGLPAGGNYTLTASGAHYTFAPSSLAVNDLAADSAGNNFTGTPVEYTVGGRVTSGGAGVAGVTVTLSGTRGATAQTDAAGAYSFKAPARGSYTVTPSKKHYKFAPQSLSFNNLTSAQAADFEATLNRHGISGRVSHANDAGMAGVGVTLSGAQAGSAVTDAQGNYSFTNLPAGGSYTIAVALQHHSFTPASRSFDDLGADARALFGGAPVNYRIAGRVTERGSPLAGVTVDLSGAHAVLGPHAGRVTTGGDGAFSFAVPAGGDYAVAPSKQGYRFDRAAASFGNLASDQTADFAAAPLAVLSFSEVSYAAAEGEGGVTVTVTRGGDTSTEVSVVYEALGDTAKRGSDFVSSIGLLQFAAGETSKTFTLFITDDAFVEGAEKITLTLAPGEGAVAGATPTATVTIRDNDTATSAANPADDDEFFVRQHYLDFFGREPDAPGLKYWTDEIRRCGTDAGCREARRVSVSAAFFLSIEFQETGYLVHRLYRASYGRAPERVGEFMLDSRVVGDGVVVGAEGWADRLAANRKAFLEEWVRRPQFQSRYDGFTDWWFLQTVFENMGVTPTEARREALLAELAAGAPRADVLAKLIEDEQFDRREFNRAFVLMQYFGYLRRNPSEAPDADLSGYEHWLRKLEEFGGDYERAEMVKAFVTSLEYRGRFGN